MKARVRIRPQRLYGDPRTTGRQETASERKHRRRRAARQRANPDVPVNDLGVPLDKADPITGEPTETEELDPRDGRCQATTKKGTRCKNKTDELYCKRHSKGTA